jgi:hypothetical protein
VLAGQVPRPVVQAEPERQVEQLLLQPTNRGQCLAVTADFYLVVAVVAWMVVLVAVFLLVLVVLALVKLQLPLVVVVAAAVQITQPA